MSAAKLADTWYIDENEIGSPLSRLWRRLISSALSLRASMYRRSSILRSRAFIAGHGPSSKALRAACTARSTSAALAVEKRATSSLVAGGAGVPLPPSAGSHPLPSVEKRAPPPLHPAPLGHTGKGNGRAPF